MIKAVQALLFVLLSTTLVNAAFAECVSTPMTTAEMRACANEAYTEADSLLSTTYNQLYQTLDKTGQDKLAASQ